MKHLNDIELIKETKLRAAKEKEATVNLIECLREVDRRKLFLEYGCSSLFKFCLKELQLSEGAAQRRIEVMRLGRKIPELNEAIKNGEITLTNAAAVATESKGKTNERELFEMAKNKTKNDFLETIYNETGKRDEKETYKRVSSTQEELTLTLDEEMKSLILELKALMAHTHPHGNLKDILKELLKEKIEKLKAPSKKQTNEMKLHGRITIPRHIKTSLKKKANYRCEIPGCDSDHKLEIDHIIPISKNGTNEMENLRVVCRNHNVRTFRHH
jgi:hypothetical protein